MTVNLDLLKRVHERITTTPEGWNQGMWATQRECGTSYCIAGWACVLSGLSVNFDAEEEIDGEKESYFLADGRYIPDVAADLLGMDKEVADSLFFTTSNPAALTKLERMIKYYEEA